MALVTGDAATAREGAAANGITKRVTLWAGRLAARTPAAHREVGQAADLVGGGQLEDLGRTRRSEIRQADVLVVVAVVTLLMAMIVSAPSAVRCEAKADAGPGWAPVADTLVSPKRGLVPS